MNTKLNPNIRKAVELRDEYQSNLKSILKDVQNKCNHEVVAEVPWSDTGNARRICLRCRYEEVGSHWSGGNTWSEKDFKDPVLGNKEDRIITTIENRYKFYNLRVG